MGDDRNEIARTDGTAGYVTYSRIEPPDGDAAHEGPVLDAIEIPAEKLGAPAPDVRADARVVPPRRGAGRAFVVFAVVALVAFAGGVGILAGSFIFPTVGKVVPVPGGGKVAAVVAESAPLDESPGQGVASRAAAPVATKVDADRFAAAHAPVEESETAPSPNKPAAATDGAEAPVKAQKVAAAPAPVAKPVPRARPEPVVSAAPTADAAPASPPSRDPLASPAGPAGSDVAAFPAPATGSPLRQTREFGSASPWPEEPDGLRVDETNDPLAPPLVVAPDQSAQSHVPPAEIPGSGYDYDREYDDLAMTRSAPVDDWSDPYQTALDRWVVLEVRDGRAIIDGRERGVFMVMVGSEIPGVGIVEDIRRRKGRWAVVTTGGSIYSSVERGERRRFWLSRVFR